MSGRRWPGDGCGRRPVAVTVQALSRSRTWLSLTLGTRSVSSGGVDTRISICSDRTRGGPSVLGVGPAVVGYEDVAVLPGWGPLVLCLLITPVHVTLDVRDD